MPEKTYKLVVRRVLAGDAVGIKCLLCGKTSYNVNDVHFRFCGYCKRYHSPAAVRLSPPSAAEV